jgi:hypothetical protein
MLIRYCRALGLAVDDPEFLGAKAQLITSTAMTPLPDPQDLAMARHRVGLDAPPGEAVAMDKGMHPPAERRRFVEEWSDSSDDVAELRGSFDRQMQARARGGISPDSASFLYEDGSGHWRVVATLSLDDAAALGYDHERLIWFGTQGVFDVTAPAVPGPE